MQVHLRSINRIIAGCLISLLLAVACAEIQLPPGGEPDKTPPAIDSTIPANEAVNVAEGNVITIYFSEQVQAGQGKQVFISPRPATDPRLKWRSDRLTITLPGSFEPHQTYIVSLNSAITDLRNNRLDSALTIAFSTDSALDTGRIVGQVFQAGKGQAGMLVGLFAVDSIADSLPFDSLYPDYLTMTGRDGGFTFQYLPSRTFQLIAFSDKNQDERFNPLRETFAVTDRPTVVGGAFLLDDLSLHTTSTDTTQPEILSAVSTASGLTRTRLSREIPLAFLDANPSAAELFPVIDSTQRRSAIAMMETGLEKSSSMTFYFGPLQPGEYRLHLRLSETTPGISSEIVQVREGTDTEPPTIIRNSPGSRPLFASDVRPSLVFSEPIDTTRLTPQTFSLTKLGADTTLVPFERVWVSPFRLNLLPDTLVSGAGYRLNITEFEILDLAGNPLGDSLTTFSFSTLNADSLGNISGTVTIELPDRTDDPAIILLRELTNKFSDTLALTDKNFSIDVPAGRYVLSGFIDSNQDGTFTEGGVWPYRFAETTGQYPDTIIVRARFETADIDFRFR